MSKLTNSQVTHAWYYSDNVELKKQPNNLYYEDCTIYSYGNHFPLATKYENCILFNNDSYSSTTSQHQAQVRNAIPYSAYIISYSGLVTNVDYQWGHNKERKKKAHKANYEIIEKYFNSMLDRASRARANKEHYLSNAEQALYDMNFYTKKFKCGFKQKSYDFGSFDSSGHKKQLKIASEKKAQAEKRKKVKDLKEWRKHKKEYLYTNGFIALRVSDCKGYVESSQGAKFAVKHCRLVWDLVCKAKSANKTTQPQVKLGIHTLHQVSKLGIVIGCHNIKFEELELIYKELLNLELLES